MFTNSKSPECWGDYFVGAVPPNALFNLSLDRLDEVLRKFAPIDGHSNPITTALELCFIGLNCYFEAFCAGQFASVVNICPSTINGFLQRRDGLSIKIEHLAAMENTMSYNFGNILAEDFDFGSPKTINSIFYDLLRFTPLNSSESEKLAKFIEIRNLLVHHIGIYNLKYRKNNPFVPLEHVYFHSISISKDEYEEWVIFLRELAKKISNSCYKYLNTYISDNGILLSPHAQDAFDAILWN